MPKLPPEQGVISKVHRLVQLTEVSELFTREFGSPITSTSLCKTDPREKSLEMVLVSHSDLKTMLLVENASGQKERT